MRCARSAALVLVVAAQALLPGCGGSGTGDSEAATDGGSLSWAPAPAWPDGAALVVERVGPRHALARWPVPPEGSDSRYTLSVDGGAGETVAGTTRLLTGLKPGAVHTVEVRALALDGVTAGDPLLASFATAPAWHDEPPGGRAP